ncbi:AraC family transcriptional regulator [Paenibacillus brasilensis]|uniref:AraC-like DNA-binding protein n=1 Tax=Paenibacillus brasilensis TaxID=128574 RepID=A0ABU0KWR0_9BACL|nr:AraC family transcriptional regulator [Paenibacillus brasilensis]MDQ0493878.1 AraC-like DNA-binding protein [Paenibacillus brasilensis]
MNINKLFFHIHYCNSSKFKETGRYPRKFTRTLSHHEFVLVTEGAGNIVIGGKTYPLKQGMLFYISPGVMHSLDPDTKDPPCFLTVHFSYAQVNFNDGQWDITDEPRMLPLHAAQELKDAYSVQDLFHKLVDCWDGKLPGYELMSRTLLQQLGIAIFQSVRKQQWSGSNSRKMEKIIQYMHQHVSSKITLTELSEMVQLSPTYLSRTFKDTTGYAVIEFFNKIKIDKAKELLIEGDKKVKEVAQALGFTDEFYFSRLFKRMEGISPSEYYSKNVHGV